MLEQVANKSRAHPEKKLLWKIVYETNLEKGEQLLADLQRENPPLYDWFEPLIPRIARWRLLHVPLNGGVTSNGAEQTNSAILPFRKLGIVHMLMWSGLQRCGLCYR